MRFEPDLILYVEPSPLGDGAGDFDLKASSLRCVELCRRLNDQKPWKRTVQGAVRDKITCDGRIGPVRPNRMRVSARAENLSRFRLPIGYGDDMMLAWTSYFRGQPRC